jgi:hypothetical protein
MSNLPFRCDNERDSQAHYWRVPPHILENASIQIENQHSQNDHAKGHEDNFTWREHHTVVPTQARGSRCWTNPIVCYRNNFALERN